MRGVDIINGLKLCVPYPALLFEEASERILMVADFHIGFEHELAESGICIPSQTPKMLSRLLSVIDEYKPNVLVFLGDVKQAIPKISLEEWRDIPGFFESVLKVVESVLVVVGNHDGDLEPHIPSQVRIVPSGGMLVGGNRRVGLFHGHAWPSQGVLAADVLVMSHIHPVMRFYDKYGFSIVRQVWVKTRCDGGVLAGAYLKRLKVKLGSVSPREVFREKFGCSISDPELIIVPAFNDLLGGLAVNRAGGRLIGPVLRSGCVDLGSSELYFLDGSYIGALGRVQSSF